jgi:thiol:disulfide interchange protein DsbD
LLCLLSLPAAAAESPATVTPRARATLITDTDAIAAATPFRAALRIVLAPGWHTYGENPGDAGVPPELTFDLPTGAKASAIAFPPPLKMQENGVITFGYTGSVVLPVTITPGAGALSLTAHANWLVCNTICVPESGVFYLDLPQGAPAPSPQAALLPAPEAAAPPPPEATGFAAAILLAFLGGLILNAMPCVFPILAMKALAIVHRKQTSHRNTIAYAAGVLASFLGLGFAVLTTSASLSGWGFQFHYPIFVALLALTLFAIGLNFSGIYTLGTSLTRIGDTLTRSGGLAGSFFTGLLAVTAATPCTAPFMGTAIAAALATSPPTGLLIFAALGAGFAAPYCLLAEFPPLTRLLPKPARWMEITKQALAFPMYAAAAWLVWVAAQQTGDTGLALVLGALVLTAIAAWAYGLAPGLRATGAAIARVTAAASLAAAIAFAAQLHEGAPVQSETAEAFTPAKLAALRASGRTVFVNLTASWCVTCLVNERLALSREDVQAAFRARDVIYLKGDWTRADPAITALLHGEGRDGVPLYLLYRPGADHPQILPQILTESIVLQALRAKPPA